MRPVDPSTAVATAAAPRAPHLSPWTTSSIARILRPGARFAAIALLASVAHLPAAETKTIPDLDLTLVKLDAGAFILGRPPGVSEPDESPETRVTFSQPFWVGATEVTVGQWRAFAQATGYKTGPEKSGAGIWVWVGPGSRYEQQPGTSWHNPGKDVESTARHPVVGIDWDDTQAFCAWLTARERAAGRLPAGYIYSLPTEAQWEYAAKAGTGAVDSEKPDEVAWFLDNSNKMAHPVAGKKPNAWGFYDMVGNVWEWCQDCYGRFPGGSVTDFVGAAPTDGSKPVRNNRGNSFSGSGRNGTNLTNRWGNIPNRENRTTLGFRLALVPEK